MYWMCVRSKQQDGVSIGHGRYTRNYRLTSGYSLQNDPAGQNGRLQVHLGYREVLSSGADTQ